MGATTGIVAVGSYDGATLGDKIDELIALLPNPDAAHGTGSVAGASQSPVGAGFLDEMSPGSAAALRVELDALKEAAAAGGDDVAYGQYTAVAADATANQTDIVTGLTGITVANIAVTISRAGSIVTEDAVITEPVDGTIRVADGGATYVLTAGDIITWFARKPTA